MSKYFPELGEVNIKSFKFKKMFIIEWIRYTPFFFTNAPIKKYMKNKENLKVGETYQIRYIGYHGYDAYNGEGVYTGKVDLFDGEENFGMKLPSSYSDENWFPLDSIFAND